MALPLNLFLIMRLCMKQALIITETANHQECCVPELSGMLPKMTYILLLKSGCCAKTF